LLNYFVCTSFICGHAPVQQESPWLKLCCIYVVLDFSYPLQTKAICYSSEAERDTLKVITKKVQRQKGISIMDHQHFNDCKLELYRWGILFFFFKRAYRRNLNTSVEKQEIADSNMRLNLLNIFLQLFILYFVLKNEEY
jgi:hypothetical protein